MGRVKSIQARLLTWECTMTFDEIPALETLESLFESEFPRTCRRLQENGGFYRIWHMVSFNSSEGRRSRFLVALVEEPLEKCSGRVLPEQIWLSAVADQIIRALPESDNAGNYLCYAHAEGRLFVFVFFEGRLCHWSEEAVEMEKALPRFRRFLQRDALFSRVGHFEELHLQGESGPDFVRAQFKKASRDSFWRRRDLQRVEMNEKNGLERWPEMLHFLRRKRFWLMAVVLMLIISSLLIAKHIHHHCTGKNCPVCSVLTQCFNNVRLLGTACDTPVLSFAFVIVFAVVLVFAANTMSNITTLISLKVELLN